MASKTATKTGRSERYFADRKSFFLLIFGFTFWPRFDQFLDHLWVSLWVSLGSLLGPLEVLLGGLCIQKHWKNAGFLRFLKMQLFGSLKLLMALLGSSCPLFGRSGPKMGPKMDPKVAQKVSKKWSKKWSQQIQKENKFWAPKWAPKLSKIWELPHRYSLPGLS